jgi:hypothetical protein
MDILNFYWRSGFENDAGGLLRTKKKIGVNFNPFSNNKKLSMDKK